MDELERRHVVKGLEVAMEELMRCYPELGAPGRERVRVALPEVIGAYWVASGESHMEGQTKEEAHGTHS